MINIICKVGVVDPATILNLPEITSSETITPEVEPRKLTEYEIFQSLQLQAERKPERKKVSCEQCGKLVPPNNIKRLEDDYKTYKPYCLHLSTKVLQ